MRRDFTGKKVVVIGAGATGLALTRYFSRRGAEVVLSDSRSAERIGDLGPLRELGVRLDLGGHTPELFMAADLVAVSPGVPLTVPAVEAARQAGVRVLGEIEIAFKELAAPLAAITGTNGKSTTTTLMGEMFSAWGKRTFVGGNLGTPLIEAVDGEWDWLVAELSSFQLEAICDFRPRYALLLNITEDHLDRYPDMASYVAAKMQVFANMGEADVAVLNAEDSLVMAAAADIRPRRILFSSRRLLPEGMGLDGEEIVWRFAGAEQRFPVAMLQLKGLHNVENVMAALIPPLLEGCPAEVAWLAACRFAGLAHRMVPVRLLDGVTWYNDSKGTNVGSVVKSLAGLAAPVTLIAGGKDKGGDYAPLAPLVREKVANLILIGQAAPRIAEALGHLTRTERAETLEAAVSRARELTPPGGSVLLSPGCSSFDMFKSYEERGDVFTRAVLALPEKEAV
jgi:UDP-N-acetylmuramoylalanine--D-glutamate ligase